MPICAIYARDSTDKQGDTIENQVSFLREYIKRRGNDWILTDDHIYLDHAFSATTFFDRPQAQLMVADARKKKFDTILFKGISRLTREIGDADHLRRFFQSINMRVISIEENYDSSVNGADFLYSIHALLAQSESEKISIRTRIGYQSMARDGKWPNGSYPIGYDRDEATKKLVVNEEQAKIIRFIFKSYTQDGLGMRKIAEQLNMHHLYTKRGNRWTQQRIKEVLTNPAYIGAIVFGLTKRKDIIDENNPLNRNKRYVESDEPHIIVRNAHEPIVTEEMFHAARRIINSRSREQYKTESLLLTGLLKCPQCGARMTGRRNHYHMSDGSDKAYKYYYCSNRDKFGIDACSQPSLNGTELEENVIDMVWTVLERYTSTDEIRAILKSSTTKDAPTPDLIANAKRQLTKIDDQIINANMRNAEGIIDNATLATIINKLNTDKRNLESEIVRLNDAARLSGDVRNEIDTFVSAIERFISLDKIDDSNLREARLLLRSLVKNISIVNGEINIQLTFAI